MSRNETEAKRRVMKKVWLRFSVWTVVVGSLILYPAPIMMADPPKDPGSGQGNNQDNNKGNGQEKVTICHKGHTIEVAKAALQAHLNHGDTVGPCSVTPSQNR